MRDAPGRHKDSIKVAFMAVMQHAATARHRDDGFSAQNLAGCRVFNMLNEMLSENCGPASLMAA